ncbi:hypothetical protein SAMN04488102_10648 [Alkalibacterium subtropicum]|uniref:Flagellar protein FliT n=1 Tax=Alkalibacterium subtropicum TaxID=753702 RepID=A0A1I1J010_9LACT|nr:hypothetical protein [Alkalibacterium subtropicum]SFC39978.1 hypothetical protein SAMN04488102_10648 [Alkalibacterium subtropicum]
MTHKAAFKSKEHELFIMLKRLNDWQSETDMAIDAAYAVLEANQESLARLSQMDAQLSFQELRSFTEKHEKVFEAMIVKQKELIQFIKYESSQRTTQLSQMNHKSKAVKSYMNNEKSLFIDRDM